MFSIVAMTLGKNVPSSRFRVRQNIEYLSRKNVSVREFYTDYVVNRGNFETNRTSPSITEKFEIMRGRAIKLGLRFADMQSAQRSDGIWLQRELIPGRRTLEGLFRVSQPLVSVSGLKCGKRKNNVRVGVEN